MKGWIKYFLDGTKEIGTDKDTREKRASWQKGRLVGLCKVEACHDLYKVSIQGYGDFWQSDDCIVPFYEINSRVIKRRIQRLITPLDKIIYLRSGNNTIQVFVDRDIKQDMICDQKILIDKTIFGKWLTLEMDTRTGEMKLFISSEKI